MVADQGFILLQKLLYLLQGDRMRFNEREILGKFGAEMNVYCNDVTVDSVEAISQGFLPRCIACLRSPRY